MLFIYITTTSPMRDAPKVAVFAFSLCRWKAVKFHWFWLRVRGAVWGMGGRRGSHDSRARAGASDYCVIEVFEP